MKPLAWYDPTNGVVSTDKNSPLFTPLGQVWGLYLKEEAKAEPYALEASMFSNDRVKIDPVTGNVGIGTPQQEAKDAPVQVSPLQFVEMVMEKEHLVGKPVFWAEWPNKGQA